MGISCEAMVRQRLKPRKCLKDIRGATLIVVQWDLLGDPPGENECAKGLKIESLSRERRNLALEKGRNKPNTRYQVPPSTKDLMREMKNWSGYADARDRNQRRD